MITINYWTGNPAKSNAKTSLADDVNVPSLEAAQEKLVEEGYVKIDQRDMFIRLRPGRILEYTQEIWEWHDAGSHSHPFATIDIENPQPDDE